MYHVDNFDDSDVENEAFVENLQTYWFKGTTINDTSYGSNVQIMTDIYTMFDFLARQTTGIDLVEICGGVGRVTTIAIRRRLNTGPNYDLVTGWNLNDPKQQARVAEYVQTQKPLVIVMGPTCKPFGKLANYNY